MGTTVGRGSGWDRTTVGHARSTYPDRTPGSPSVNPSTPT